MIFVVVLDPGDRSSALGFHACFQRLSPYTAVKFCNRGFAQKQRSCIAGFLFGYKRLLQEPSTFSKLLVLNQLEGMRWLTMILN